MSLIIHGGNELDSRQYFSGVFYVNTGIWWHCDNDKITQINDFQKLYITERVKNNIIQRKTLCQAKKSTIDSLYHNNQP